MKIPKRKNIRKIPIKINGDTICVTYEGVKDDKTYCICSHMNTYILYEKIADGEYKKIKTSKNPIDFDYVVFGEV